MPIRILVTGASGFLGQTVVRQLRETPHELDVITTDLGGDVSLTGNLADGEFTSALPDADIVIHCAAVQYVTENLPLFRRKNFFETNNIVATTNLVNRYSGKVSLFVNVGTSMMYSLGATREIDESTLFANNGVYSASKISSWDVIRDMSNPTAMVVPCIIAGPGRGGLFVSLTRSIERRNIAIIPGRGDTLVQAVHVADVAKLLVCVSLQGREGVYNAGAPGTLTINDWVDIIEDSIDSTRRVRRIHVPLGALLMAARLTGWRLLAKEQLWMLKQDHSLRITKSIKIGWEPQYSNAQIIESTAEAILNE